MNTTIIDDKTQLTGSIAAKQSRLAPAMYNAAFQSLGLNYLYLALTITNCRKGVEAIRALNFRGVAVSMPYKREVMKYLDKINPVAKKIGAVNTIINNHKKLEGYNSDWIGAVQALKEATSLRGKNVALIGAGGAARAVVFGLKKNGARVTIFNRTIERGESLAKEFHQKFGGAPKNLKENHSFDVLVNATSVGYENLKAPPIVNEGVLKKGMVVLDIVFSPLQTNLLKIAKQKGCRVVPGYRMLIHQAVFQFHKFTGKRAPFRIMERALVRTLL
jgi:shikimate dehydrogenase